MVFQSPLGRLSFLQAVLSVTVLASGQYTKNHAKTAGNTPFEHWCCSKGANRMKLPGDMQAVKICPLFC